MSESDPSTQPQHLLLFEFIAESLSSKILLILKPKDILKGESFRLRLKITNKGSEHFPGGEIVSTLRHRPTDISDNLPQKPIPPLAPGESDEIDYGNWHAFSSDIIHFEAHVKASDQRNIHCYQKLPASNKLELMPELNYWIDFIHVSSKSEIQQRYTNTILVVLTAATVIYYILTVFIKFPIK